MAMFVIFTLFLFSIVDCSENANMTSLLENMKRLESSVNKKFDICEKEMQKLENTIQQQEDMLNRLQHMPSKRQSGPNQMVAFTTYVDNPVDHLGIDQVIPYNRVITNIGGGFNTLTHIFTCPVSGLYFFGFFVGHAGPHEIVAKLVLDGENIVDGIADSGSSGDDRQGGNMAVIRVKKGQIVHVSNYYDKDTYLRSLRTFRFSSFTGLLLQRDDPASELTG